MRYLYIVFALFLFYSCKQTVHLTITEPAPVFIEKDYVKVGVVNRSYSGESSRVIDAIENALTLEGNLDREGATKAVEGMFDQLANDKRFIRKVMLDSLTVENGGSGVFPATLPWAEVEKLCQEADIQLLFVLEAYDTDTKINYSSQTINKSTPLGTVPVLQHTARVTTIIKTGWRIYDPVNKIIRDEQLLVDQIILSGNGITPAGALAAILNRGQSVRQLSYDLGRSYSDRINEQSFRVWRTFFNKGSENLRQAKRKSEVGDWEGAADLWMVDTKSTKRKVAGRAAYNMAVYEEINGDVYKAYEWAKIAYTDYRIKPAFDYSNLLRDRINRIEHDKALREMDGQ